MPPLPTPFSALRSLTRLHATPKPQSPSRFLRQISPRTQHQHLPLALSTCSKFYSTSSPPLTSSSTPRTTATHKPHAPNPTSTPESPKPEYEMTFTCTPCSTRSTHRVSKQGYHKGSVLITCPECKNRHVISDHLNIFGDKNITIEDLMREQGQLVKKGTLSEDGNFEFWADGTTTPRTKTNVEEAQGLEKKDGDGK